MNGGYDDLRIFISGMILGVGVGFMIIYLFELPV